MAFGKTGKAAERAAGGIFLEIRIRDEFIKLGQALKLADLVSDGVEAKYVINDGLVKVNGEVDTRRGRKVYGGDVISYNGQDVKVLSGNE